MVPARSTAATGKSTWCLPATTLDSVTGLVALPGSMRMRRSPASVSIGTYVVPAYELLPVLLSLTAGPAMLTSVTHGAATADCVHSDVKLSWLAPAVPAAVGSGATLMYSP